MSEGDDHKERDNILRMDLTEQVAKIITAKLRSRYAPPHRLLVAHKILQFTELCRTVVTESSTSVGKLTT